MSTEAMIRARRRWIWLAVGAFIWHAASSLLVHTWWEPIAEPGWAAVVYCVGHAAYYHGRIKEGRR